MITMKQTTVVTGLILASLVATAAWAAQKSPEEQAIEYRQSAFKMIGHHFGPMAAMVKGEVEFNAEEFKKNAAAVATLSQFPIAGFIDGSYEGKTRAKADIASNMDDFKEKMETFKVEAANLAKAAESGDMAVIKPQFGKTGQSCKACHDDYRNKE